MTRPFFFPRLWNLLLTLCGLAFSQNAPQQPGQQPGSPPPRGTLTGKVQLDGNGKPLEGVQIQVSPPQGPTVTAQTNPDGVYQLRNALAPGRYRVRAMRSDSRGVLGAPLQKFVTVTANSETA